MELLNGILLLFDRFKSKRIIVFISVKIRFPRTRKRIINERNLRPGKLREAFCIIHFILLQDAIMSSTSWGKRALKRMLTTHFPITDFVNAEIFDEGSPK